MPEAERLPVGQPRSTESQPSTRDLRNLQIRLAAVGDQAVLGRINELLRTTPPTEQINQEVRAWELFLLRELRDHRWVRADLALEDYYTHQGQTYSQLPAATQLRARESLARAWLEVVRWVTGSDQSFKPVPQRRK